MQYQTVCLANEMDYPAPPRPADCQTDWGPFFYIGDDSGSFGICAGDPQIPAPTPPPPMPYGTTSVSAGQACQSTESGVVCWDTKTRHGFRVARADYELF